MSNIEKLLDQLLRYDGERLVICTDEPIFVLKGDRKLPLLKKSLSETEFGYLETEYSTVFNNSAEISYQGKTLLCTREGLRREYRVMNSAGSASEAPPEPPAIDEPPKVAQMPSPAPAPPEPAAAPVETPSPSGRFNLDEMLRLMLEQNASDLHIASKCKPVMRIDGDIITQEDFPVLTEDNIYKEIVRIAPERNVEEFQETNDSDFAYAIEGAARFRANVFRDIHGVGAVFRVIPSKILTVEDLSIPRAVVDLCDIPKGLILVTGPTGSGKSTTLAALINHINETQKRHIITIEDPVEFVHNNKLSLINQREVHTHTQLFKKALRAALREDPDIILVGEMRDLETIAIAIEMAVTGHLVFGTLHTSTAIGTIDRIIDQFPADQQSQIKTMMADALIGVISQTLCKRKEKGRVGSYEVLVVTPAVSNLIREGKNFQIATLMQTGKGIGMQMINSHLSELVEKGVVDAEEAISRAIDKESLRTLLKNKGLYKE